MIAEYTLDSPFDAAGGLESIVALLRGSHPRPHVWPR